MSRVRGAGSMLAGRVVSLLIEQLSDRRAHLRVVVERDGERNEHDMMGAMVLIACASGNTVPAIAKLVATSEERVREMTPG